MGASEKIVLGSRGSDLALAQAKMVEQALRDAWPGLEVATEIIRTSGDEGARPDALPDRKAGRKGMFTREIEKELLVRRIDLAVHSAKDLPSEPGDELVICATLPRGSTEDVLVTKDGSRLTNLPAGAVVATGSVRRQRQLGWRRPDLEVAALSGNVPTRLRKLRESESWSGIILARAGLERLGWDIVGRALRLPDIKNGAVLLPNEPGQPGRSPYSDFSFEMLSPDDFLPAGGQGVIALQARRDDERVQRLVAAINHEPTLLCLRAEREFLRLLDGDCDSPVGIHASIADGKLRLQAQVFEEQVLSPRVGVVSGVTGRPEALAAELMSKLYAN